MKRHQFSPLSQWIVVAAISIFCVAIMLLINPRPISWNRTTKTLLKRINATNFDQKSTSILFLGNSLLQFALPASEPRFAARLESRFALESHRTSVQLMDLTFGGQSAQNISVLADHILSMKPKAVVMQVELIFNRGGIDSPNERLGAWAQFLKMPILKYLPHEEDVARMSEKVFGKAERTATFITFRPKKPAETFAMKMTRKLWTDQSLSAKDETFRLSTEFIQRARARRIRIIVVQTPLSVTATRVAPADYLRRRNEIVNKLFENDPDAVLRFPEILPDDHFRDYRHVNAKGQQKFLAWLVPQLVRTLSKEAHSAGS